MKGVRCRRVSGPQSEVDKGSRKPKGLLGVEKYAERITTERYLILKEGREGGKNRLVRLKFKQNDE